MLSIIIPTYNEAKNLQNIVEKTNSAIQKTKHEIIIVDDNSPDNTAEVAQELQTKYPLKLIKRTEKKDLSLAVVEGFRHAKGEILGVMDADMSHDPSYLPQLLTTIEQGNDIAIGSRHIKNGKIEDWPINKRIVSIIGQTFAKPLTKVNDPMSGFFLLKREVIENAALDPIGYKIGLEIIIKGNYSSIKEVPIIFKNRHLGKSKANIRSYVRFIQHIGRLYKHRLSG